MSNYTPFDIDPCPVCGCIVTDVKQEQVSPYYAPYNQLLPVTSQNVYTAYTQTIVRVGPCGHEVDCQSEGNKIRLFAKQKFDDTPNGQYDQFVFHLQSIAASNGWQVYASTTYASIQVNLYWMCPHGQQYGTIDSWMASTIAPLQFAQMIWQKVHGMCQCQYGWNTNWAGPNTWVTYPSPSYYTTQYFGGGSIGGNSTLNTLLKLCPGLKDATASCPECGTISGFQPLSNLIVHLNDSHKWMRECIADWLDTLPLDLSIKPTTEGKKNGNDSIGSKTTIAATGDFAGNADALALAKEYGKYLQAALGGN